MAARAASESCGCDDPRERIGDLPALRLHVFGHIHESYGMTTQNDVTFVNAAVFGRSLKGPIIVDIA